MVTLTGADSAETESEDRYLPAVARAMVYHPNGNLQDLAKAIGVSKATLYRFCKTRAELVDRVVSYVGRFCIQAIHNANLADVHPAQGLHNLIANHLEGKDLILFMVYHWRPEYLSETHHDHVWIQHEKLTDAFFLQGQEMGVFRLDMSAATMTELFYSLIAGLVDAEHRGRIPRSELAALLEMNIENCLCKR